MQECRLILTSHLFTFNPEEIKRRMLISLAVFRSVRVSNGKPVQHFRVGD